MIQVERRRSSFGAELLMVPDSSSMALFAASAPYIVQPGECPPITESASIFRIYSSLNRFFIKIGLPLLLLVAIITTPTCAPWILLLFVPTAILYTKWKKYAQNYLEISEMDGQSDIRETRWPLDLDTACTLYRQAGSTGAIGVMIIETILAVIFEIICFGEVQKGIKREHGVGTGNNLRSITHKIHESKQIIAQNDDLMLPDMPNNVQFYLFLFLTCYAAAGLVEEGMKYYITKRLFIMRPRMLSEKGVRMAALAVSLGFSTIENIGYLYSACAVADGSQIIIGTTVIERICISTPVHLMTGFLMSLFLIRAHIRKEDLPLWRILSPSIFWHGTFDFLLMVIGSQTELSDATNFFLTTGAIVFVIGGLTLTIIVQLRTHCIDSGSVFAQLNLTEPTTSDGITHAQVVYIPLMLTPLDYNDYIAQLSEQQHNDLKNAQAALNSQAAIHRRPQYDAV